MCRRPLCCFLLSFLSSWHHIAPLSNSLWLISSSPWPRYAMLVLLIASSFRCFSLFSSRLSQYRSNISFIIKMCITSVSSTVPLQLLPVLSPSLMSSAIVSISRSTRIKAVNFQQSESGTPDSISGSLSVSRSKRIRMLLGQHLTSSFILKLASTRS